MLGAIIGTLIAMTYRMIIHVDFMSKNVSFRYKFCFYKKFISFGMFFIVSNFLAIKFFHINSTILGWSVSAVALTIYFAIVYLICSFVFFKNDTVSIFSYIQERILKKRN